MTLPGENERKRVQRDNLRDFKLLKSAKPKNQLTRPVSVRMPVTLHKFLRLLCIQTGLSATEIIVQYLHYLKKYKNVACRLLHKGSAHEPEFKVDNPYLDELEE